MTTVAWSMLADMFLFSKPFYPLYAIAFVFEIIGVLIYSKEEPKSKNEAELEKI